MRPVPRLIKAIAEIQDMIEAERAGVSPAADVRVAAEQQGLTLANEIAANAALDAAVRDTAARAAAAHQERIDGIRQLAGKRAQALDQAARDLADLARTIGSAT